MHLRVLYVVMVCSGTSVRSARRRRGAKPLAVAAAAICLGEDVAASQQPSVAAAALFRPIRAHAVCGGVKVEDPFQGGVYLY